MNSPQVYGTFRQGLKDSLPIFVGYYSASIAFGLLCVSGHLQLWQALGFSLTNFAGASQFLAVGLLAAGTAAWEIFMAVFLVNLRYFLMSTVMVRKFPVLPLPKKIALAFGNTDEVFSVASLKPGLVAPRYFFAMEAFAYTGWALGTLTGFVAGSLLPPEVQAATAVTLYALFAALLAPELKKGGKIILTALLAAAVNTLALKGLGLSTGVSLALAIALAPLPALFLKEGKPAANPGV